MFSSLSTYRETAKPAAVLGFSMASKSDKEISFAPLGRRLRKKGDQSKFASKLNVSPQVLTNWKRRGTVPAAEVGRVAKALGITYEQYLIEASPPGVQQQTGQYLVEVSAMLEDYRALPKWLQAHVARKITELRRYSDSLPPYVRENMQPPPIEQESYRRWQLELENDLASRPHPRRAA